MQIPNKAYKKLIDVIIFIYQVYRLYSEILGEVGGNSKVVNVIN